MDEQVTRLYNEIRKEIVKDNLKLMKDTSQEYITLAGEAFLDGLQINGECVEIVSKVKYDELLKETKLYKEELLDIRKLNKKLFKENNNLKGLNPKKPKKWF